MKTDQIMCCIVALLLGMLLANMFKNVCGCKNVVEGQGDDCIKNCLNEAPCKENNMEILKCFGDCPCARDAWRKIMEIALQGRSPGTF